ncbi:MAG: FAD-dependent oxidoreductase [Parvibaculales bacterium]
MDLRKLKRFIPLAVIVVVMALVLSLGLDRYLSFEALRQNEAAVKEAVKAMPVLSAFLFTLLYVLVVALSLPAATVLTLTGGLVFGTFVGGVLTIAGATGGACLLFLAARTALGNALRQKAGPRLQQFQEGFQKDAASYLLMVRFIPVFPFFLVNIAAALTNVSFSVFLLTTAVGIAPGTFVYASVGNGLSVVLSQGGVPDLSIIFNPEVFLPLCGLGLLSLAPVFVRKYQQVKDIELKKRKLIKADICVIGAGSGGLSVAAGAAQMGARTVLVERDKMGGDCLNTGCVPSKALLAAAHASDAMQQGKALGVSAARVKIDFDAVKAHVRKVIADIEPHDSVERFESLGVTVLKGNARFLDSQTAKVGTYQIQAKKFVIATGSAAAVPPIQGLRKTDFMTNETIFDLKKPPEHLLIIGGGAIGVEMAQAHARLGSKVTILEADRLLPRSDPDLAGFVRDRLVAEGVECLEGVKIKSVVQSTRLFKITLLDGETTKLLTGSHLLVATGRRPQTARLDLDMAGIEFDDTGIKVDDRLRTSNKRVFAVGDVTGLTQLTHAAGYHAGIVIRNALFKLPAKARHDVMPQVVYTDPELAQVGLTEAEAVAGGLKVKVLTEAFSGNDRARAENDIDGMIKVVLTPKGKILGAGIVGKNAGDLLAPWTLALEQKLSISAMAGTIAPYPTRGEISKRVAGSYYTPTLFSAKTRGLVKLLNLFS